MVWPAKGEIKNYIVRVDYSSFDTAAICLVRTGKSDAEMTVTDSSGNKVASLTSNSTYARSWKFVDNQLTQHLKTIRLWSNLQHTTQLRIVSEYVSEIKQIQRRCLAVKRMRYGLTDIQKAVEICL